MSFVPCFSCISRFLSAVLEELDSVCREVTDLQHRLSEVKDQCEALEEGAVTVFCVVKPRAPMWVDQLHALPKIICSAVRLGIHRGAAAALASVQLRTIMHLGGIDPSFSKTSSTAVRPRTNFAGFGRVVAAEMDVNDLLQRGMDPDLDGL